MKKLFLRPAPLLTIVLMGTLCAPGMRVAAAAALENFVATYSVRTAGLTVGKMERRLVVGPGSRYRFESTVKPSGLAAMLSKTSVEETSEGQLTENAIRPDFYAYRRTSGRKRKVIESRFDWANGRVITNNRGVESDVAATAGVLDKLVYQLALMRDLARGDDSLEYLVADGDRIKTYTLARAGDEAVEINRASVVTQKIVYAREGSKRRTTLWCAASYGYMPVQIEYREDDSSVTLATLTGFR